MNLAIYTWTLFGVCIFNLYDFCHRCATSVQENIICSTLFCVGVSTSLDFIFFFQRRNVSKQWLLSDVVGVGLSAENIGTWSKRNNLIRFTYTAFIRKYLKILFVITDKHTIFDISLGIQNVFSVCNTMAIFFFVHLCIEIVHNWFFFINHVALAFFLYQFFLLHSELKKFLVRNQYQITYLPFQLNIVWKD